MGKNKDKTKFYRDKHNFYTLLLIIITMFLGGMHTCAQTFEDTIGYDCMEMYNWSGNWWNNKNYTGFANNVSISAPASAYLYGTGNANSKVEDNWYSLPAIDTLSPTEEHKVKFHICSPRITNTGGTSGIDIDDFIDIQVSIDGGPYVSEVRITGNSNAYWEYNSKTISKVVNGLTELHTPAGGGDRTALGDGFSIVELIFPLGTTSIAIDVYTRANSAGEEFWFDDFFMLGSGGGGSSLPIVLTSFDLNPHEEGVGIEWVVHSQVNNDYYTIEKSKNAIDWVSVENINGAGNSNTEMRYHIVDSDPFLGVSYYRLTQTDFNGEYETFPPKSVEVKDNKTIGLHIYPNPAIDYIELDMEYSQYRLINHDVQIFDIEGHRVYKKHFIGELRNFSIDIQKFKPGVYMVTSDSDNIKGKGKFFKK